MTRVRALLCLAAVVSCFIGLSAAGAPVPTKSSEGLVVHEWGTFSTFSGSDGAFLKFQPNDRDLPPFVHSLKNYIKGALPDVFVSLETPVLYFYTDKELTASVGVRFPRGRMTEWYPGLSRPPFEELKWDAIKVFPKGQTVPLKEEGKSRYYAARETDASSLRVPADKGKVEHEKFLFYRGVGDCRMPLSVRALGKGSFTVKNSGKHVLPGFVLVQARGGKVRFQTYGPLAGGAEVSARETLQASSADKLGEELVRMLTAEGLYEKEARAMVKTWRTDWFEEEGTRVLYLVPAALTDELLPLRITPKPRSLVRVLVGRHDVLTPEQEREIDRLVQKLRGPSNADARAADVVLKKLGRYRSAAQTAAGARLKGKVQEAATERKGG